MGSKSFRRAESEFGVKKKYSMSSFRNIRGFLANWAFFAVFSILNRKKQNFGNLTFKNENIDHNNDLEKRKSEKS